MILKIKEVRNSKQLTQDDVVALTGIKKRSYVDYENGKADITITNLQIIATALGVEIIDLIEHSKTKTTTSPDFQQKYIELLEENRELHNENKRLRELVGSTGTISFPKQRPYAVAEDDPDGLAGSKKKLKKSKS